MDIAIIGAGWFGCHLGISLRNHHKITIFEKDEVFAGASGHNQNRLHLGFHYPRSFETRMFAREGYEEFVNTYGKFCECIDCNLYAIAKKHSLIDYQTYLHIMDASNLEYQEVDPDEFDLNNVSGCIKVKEQLILTSKAKDFFSKELKSNIVIKDFDTVLTDDFDLIINCSSQAMFPNENWDLIFEPCLVLNYKCKEKYPAITIMDGKLCTVYPKEDDVYTVYSVEHSPLSIDQFSSKVGPLKNKTINDKIKKFEEVVLEYLPNFKSKFEYCGYEVSLRSTLNDQTDLRIPSVEKIGKIIHVLPSKVDHVFHCEREVKNIIKNLA